MRSSARYDHVLVFTVIQSGRLFSTWGCEFWGGKGVLAVPRNIKVLPSRVPGLHIPIMRV